MREIAFYERDIKEKYSVKINEYVATDEANKETVFTLCNGYMGVRGALLLGGRFSEAGTYIAGLFDKKEKEESEAVCGLTIKNKAITPALAIVPDGNLAEITAGGEKFDVLNCRVSDFSRTLDLLRGFMVDRYSLESKSGKVLQVKTMNFVLKSSYHESLIRTEITPVNFDGEIVVTLKNTLNAYPQYIPRLRDYICATVLESTTEENGTAKLNARVFETGEKIIMLARTQGDGKREVEEEKNGINETFVLNAESGKTYAFDKRFAYFTSRDNCEISFSKKSDNQLIDEHFEFYKAAWERAKINIDGDDEVLKGVLWNSFNLIQLEYPENTDISIAATGLHGQGYFGHAFWDTEIFMLPFYLATCPEEAKALLEYRYKRLDEAREIAKSRGFSGAEFPWTSAYTGADVTPPDWDRCAKRQIHISADVAYAFRNYYVQTGDYEFYKNCGIETIIETAKFFASRAVLKDDRKYHLLDVIGPDEYNIHADDNFYTNFMARYNIREALSATEELKQTDEIEYKRIAEKTQYEEYKPLLEKVAENMAFPKTKDGVIEQYDGFFRLKDGGAIERDENGMPKNKNYVYASDVQVLKQADAVMALYLFPDEFDEKTQKATFDYYEKRCNHGSSLSPSIHAIVGLRNGFKDHAYSFLRLTALLDLNNMHLDKNLHEGLHTACAGGTWSAVVYGFGGVEFKRGDLYINPTIPDKWNSFSYRFTNKGVNYLVEVEKNKFSVIADKDTAYFVKGEKAIAKKGELKQWKNI